MINTYDIELNGGTERKLLCKWGKNIASSMTHRRNLLSKL